MRFKEIPESIQCDKLQKIVEREQINLEPSVLSQLVEISKGDLRKSVNLLQLSKLAYSNKEITIADLEEITDVMVSNNFEKDVLEPYKNLRKEKDRLSYAENLTKQGISCSQLLEGCYKWISQKSNYPQG